MSYFLKGISLADLDAVVALAHRTLIPRWSAQEYGSVLKQPAALCLGAYLDEQLCAFILTLVVNKEMDVVAIACAPEKQRQGLAFQVLSAAIARGQINRSTLEVDPTNEAAVKLYLKAGFQVRGVRKKYYEGKRDAWTMVWERSPIS